MKESVRSGIPDSLMQQSICRRRTWMEQNQKSGNEELKQEQEEKKIIINYTFRIHICELLTCPCISANTVEPDLSMMASTSSMTSK